MIPTSIISSLRQNAVPLNTQNPKDLTLEDYKSESVNANRVDKPKEIIRDQDLKLYVLKYDSDPVIQAKNLQILDRYYDSYEKIFTISDEVTSKETYADILTNPDHYPKTTVSLTGIGFDKPETAKVIAFAHGEYYPRSQTALRTYVGTLKDDFLISKEIFGSEKLVPVNSKQVTQSRDEQFVHTAQSMNLKVLAMVSEINNPVITNPAEDIMDPWLRMKVTTQQRGGELMKYDYVQPALGEGQDAIPLGMMNYRSPDPSVEGRAEPKQIKAFLTDFYDALGVEDLKRNKDFEHACNQLDELQSGAARPKGLSDAMEQLLDVMENKQAFDAKMPVKQKTGPSYEQEEYHVELQRRAGVDDVRNNVTPPPSVSQSFTNFVRRTDLNQATGYNTNSSGLQR